MNVNLATVGLSLAQANTSQVETTTVAPGGTEAPTTQPAPWWANGQIGLILAVVVFFLFITRSKSKQEKQRTAMLNALKRGDRIQTIGGVLGTVVDVSEEEVVVKVDESRDTKITFLRSAIHRVREEAKK